MTNKPRTHVGVVLGQTLGVIPLRDDNPTAGRSWAVYGLILACIGIFLFIQPDGRQYFSQVSSTEPIRFAYEFAVIPCELTSGRPIDTAQYELSECDIDDAGAREFFPDKNIWLAVVYSMFLHGGVLHLGFNMLFLWVFGNNIEDRFGVPFFLLFYLAAGVFATEFYVLFDPGATVPLVGASGAIAGVMGAYLVLFPHAKIQTLLTTFVLTMIQIPAKIVLVIWFVLQFLTSPNSGIAWTAHVGGFLFGVAVGVAVRVLSTNRSASEEFGGFEN